jgi:hypothetical protein
MCDGPVHRLSRRGTLIGLLAGSVAACSENSVTGRNQLILVSDGQLARWGG